jgi:hypothetical protein
MFDPYYKWLGIPPKDQPPNHYRLLAIDVFECDSEVIDAAANRQMAYVQQRATGEHAKLSQKLLNELAAARLCLLDPKKRATYDLQLRINLAQQARQAEKSQAKAQKPGASGRLKSAEPLIDKKKNPPPPPRHVESSSTPHQPASQSVSSRAARQSQIIFLAVGGSLLLVGILVIILFVVPWINKEPDIAKQKPESGEKIASEDVKGANTQIQKRPTPTAAAIYNVEIDPPTAVIDVKNYAGAVTGSGRERQIRLENVPWRGTVLVNATCDGYKEYTKLLVPKAGKTENLSIEMEKDSATSSNAASNLRAGTNSNSPQINRPKAPRIDSLANAVEKVKTERFKVFAFSGTSAIVTPVQRSLPSTVEAWIWVQQPAESADMYVFGSDNAKQTTGGLGVRIRKNGQLAGRRTQANKKQRDFGTGESAPIMKWTHLAVTFDDDKICFFVNGHLVHTDKGAQNTDHAPFVIGYIGYGPYKYPSCFFVGRMRTVRISTGIRYDSDFSPPFDFNKNQDKEGVKTSLIYDASNIKGDQITDISGNKKDGAGLFIKIVDDDIPIQ